MEKYLITGKDRIKEMEDKQEIPKYNKNNQNIKPFDLKKHPTKLNKGEKLIVPQPKDYSKELIQEKLVREPDQPKGNIKNKYKIEKNNDAITVLSKLTMQN